MTKNEIEYLWKVASNNPNHDTNWNEPVVVAFAKLVAQHEREACAKVCEEQMQGKSIWIEGARACSLAIRARGQA